MDKELNQFANDVYDVLMGNDHFCTQSQFAEKYDADNIEINCSINQENSGLRYIETNSYENN